MSSAYILTSPNFSERGRSLIYIYISEIVNTRTVTKISPPTPKRRDIQNSIVDNENKRKQISKMPSSDPQRSVRKL